MLNRIICGLTIFVVVNTAFAQLPQSSEQIGLACKPYLEQYSESQGNVTVSPAELNTLKACDAAESCTNALVTLPDCARKLGILLNQPKPKPIPTIVAPTPQSTEKAITPQKPAPMQAPAAAPTQPIAQPSDNDQSIQPQQETPPPPPQQQEKPATKSNNNSNPSINWF